VQILIAGAYIVYRLTVGAILERVA